MQNKILEFKKRNQKRNQHLYASDTVQGYDYVVCPISGERLSMIKSSYIINVLGMKIEEYPVIQRICDKRIQNIKNGLKEIDPKSGLTRYEIGQTKARQVLKKIDSDGSSGYQRKGQKTRATHLTRIDNLGRNGYRRQADLRLTTVLENGLTIEQNAHRKQKETLIRNKKSGSGGASKQSKKVLAPLIELLEKNNIKFYFDFNEYGILDPESGNYYFWDLTIPDFKITIEYQSSVWHADPSLSESEWASWKTPKGKQRTAVEVLTYDYNKARSLFKHREIVTYYVWEKTQENDIEEILCLLKTLIMKY